MKSGAAETILRWGLAFVFFYAGVDALVDPLSWLGYLPGFAAGIGSLDLALTVFAVYEIVLAAWLFTGRRVRWSAMFATVTLVLIAIFNFSSFLVTFRDIGLAFAALALFELGRERKVQEGDGPAAAEEEFI